MAIQKTTTSNKTVEEGKIVAILSYFLIGIIWYFVDEKMKKNAFARFHAQQGLAFVILYVALGILSVILSFLSIIWWILYIALFILWIIGLIKAATGKMEGALLVDKLAEKLAI